MDDIKIFIVEDELIAAESLAVDLKKLGYEVIGIANSKKKALPKIFSSPPDLVLMDIKLKGEGDGVSIAEEIRKAFSVPIIYLTAYADNATIDRAKFTSPYGYLVKPYKFQDLKTTISMALQKYADEQKTVRELDRERELNLLKTHALAVASHDLRTPLTSILGFSELLRDYTDQLTPQQRERYFNSIISAVGNMNDCLEDLLIVSRAEEGRLPFNPQAMDVVLFSQEMVNKFEPNLLPGQKIIFECEQKSFEAGLDRQLVQHILQNLISNAIKYSPIDTTITVHLICHLEQIQFKVVDEGIGIPESYRDKLFQLFERADNVGNIKGTGLGLSIVKKAVELHSGKIEVDSVENEGTTFYVTLQCSQGLI